MLKKKKIVKIFLFFVVLLGGILLPNIFTNAAISPNNEFNFVIYLHSEDVEVNKSYVRILYYFDEDGYSLLSYPNDDLFVNNNSTSVNLLGRDFTLYVVNAIVNNNNIIISQIADYESFNLMVDSNLYDEGYLNGYDNAKNESNDIAYNNGYNSGYNEGYNLGSSSGYSSGYNEGLTIGYNNGFYEGQTSNSDNFSLLSLLSLILMYPFKIIALGFDVDIFGVNIGAVIIGILAIGLVVGIISIFRGGKNE